jgi:hypothetical protein
MRFGQLILIIYVDVEWSALGVDLNNMDAEPVPYVHTSGTTQAAPYEVYRDTAMALWVETPPYLYDDQLNYRVANLSTPAIAVFGWTEDDSFETQISFKQAQDTSVITKLPLFAYPFDEVSSNNYNRYSETYLITYNISLVGISGKEALLSPSIKRLQTIPNTTYRLR